MGTTTRRSGAAPERKGGTAKTTARERPAAKPATRERAAAKPAPRGGPATTQRERPPAAPRSQTRRLPTEEPPEEDHLRDAWAVGLLVLGALSALGLYAHAAGVAGQFLELLCRGLFGVGGLAVPPALAAGAVLLFRDPRPGHRRIVGGSAMIAAALLGLWHLASGAPGFRAPAVDLHASAGWAGAALALPLRALLAVPGAVLLLVVLGVSGLLVVTGTRPRTIVRRASLTVALIRARAHERRVRRRLAAGAGASRPRDEHDESVLVHDDDDVSPPTQVAAAPARLDMPPAAEVVVPAPPVDVPGLAATLALPVEPAAAEAPTIPRGVRPEREPFDRTVFEGLGDDDDEDQGTDEPLLSDTQLLPRGLDLDAPRRTPPPAAEAPTVRLDETSSAPLNDDGEGAPPQASAGEGDEAAATRLAPPEDDWSSYELPALTLLRAGRAAPGNRKTLEQMTAALERTLAQFGVDAFVGKVSRGPTVTRFELSLGEGVRVGAVTKLGDDISYALATAEIRIVAPIPGKSAIGIEVPNRERDLITLGDVLRSPEAAATSHPLAAGIGVDIAGHAVIVNLATMPHLLIAGATGSGKSVTMNGLVTSVVTRATPAQARMILIDPKRVELNHYEGIPHLLTPVVTDPKRATEALAWTVKEMEQRYERLALLGYRNIDTYNAAVADGSVRQAPALSGRADVVWEELPYILVVIDELADLMMVAPRDVEGAIVRIAQMARAVGIHLVVATQRPSVDVVTGLIKANIPSRIALAMATQADSRTILDQGGAEKLVGHGDMLFMPANASKPHRIQGCYVDEAEIEAIVSHCRGQRHAEYAPGVVRTDAEQLALAVGEDADDDTLRRAAMDLVVRSGLGSTSMLQRKLKVGFARAGRLMDELEQLGVVGPSEGPKARQVLMSVEELENRQQQGL